MANILVTGGAGYIGSHTCKFLKKLGHTPVTYDNLSRGFEKLVNWGPLVKGDLLDFECLTNTMRDRQIEAVIHFAAYAYVGESMEKPEMYMENNVSGSTMLFEAMREEGVENILFSSSCAVYGESQEPFISESHPKKPINPYGLSKLMVEQILEKSGLNHCSLRYFNVGGADPDGETGECHEPEPHILPNLLKNALNDQTISLFGNDYPTEDGTCIRDYIHVTDLAEAHGLALEALLKNKNKNSAYNLGTGKGHSLLELTQSLESILNKKIEVEFKDRRIGDPAQLVANPERFKKEFQWNPQYSDLNSIFTTARNWMEKN